MFDNPFSKELETRKLGKEMGGGTGPLESGGMAFSDMEVQFAEAHEKVSALVTYPMKSYGAPKGSSSVMKEAAH